MSIAPRPFLIGVAGGTCSGKSTVSERLAELVGPDHLALTIDASQLVAVPIDVVGRETGPPVAP